MSDIKAWQHDHIFKQDQKRAGEHRTLIVTILTGLMMVAEIIVGIASGSMALLADGLHMASHAVALGINLFAYSYARRHANDTAYSFGTGKVNSLGGFAGAILLVVFAAIMAWESAKRFIQPIHIDYNQAILVAILGLIVNGVSVFVLDNKHHHEHDHHDHHEDHDHHHDHNLRSAYLHVLADALTSLLAIIALIAAKYLNAVWADPLMGIVGAILVTRWSIGLLGSTCSVLLDKEGPVAARELIRKSVEANRDSRVADLHLWSIGPNIYSTIISIVTSSTKGVDDFKTQLPQDIGLKHITIEIHRHSNQ